MKVADLLPPRTDRGNSGAERQSKERRRWTTTAGWTLACALPSLLLLSFFLHPIGVPAGVALLALLLLSVLRPYEGLLFLAALVPLSTILFLLLSIEAGGLRLIEGMTLAWVTGWAAHRGIKGHAIAAPQPLAWSAGALMAAALASAVVSGAAILTEQGGDTALRLIDDWFRSYAVHLDAVTFAVLFAEGLLLLLAVTDTCAEKPLRREAVMQMMAVGAAATAVFNLLRIVEGALAHEEPWRHAVELFLHLRVNVHYGDLNAAGSYFALVWFLAAGLTLYARDRTARALGLVLLVLISVGLWLAGSRVALAAVCLVTAVVLTERLVRHAHKIIAIAAFSVVLTGAAAAMMVPFGRHVADPGLALQIRLGLATGALAMTADHPFFGVGLGRFYQLSDAYVHVPNYIVRENAHNNFLQVLAELGISGFVLFIAVVGAALAAARRGEAALTWPLVAGVSAFLLTCIGGHPLLITYAAFPFWMALGLCASSTMRARSLSVIRTGGLLLVAFFIVTLPPRVVSAVRGANVESTSIGLSLWQRETDGTRFRWAAGRATFFAPTSATAVRFRVRHGNQGPDQLQVRIFIDGREADRLLLNRREPWRTVRLILDHKEAPFSRIELMTGTPGQLLPSDVTESNEGGILLVGPLEIER